MSEKREHAPRQQLVVRLTILALLSSLILFYGQTLDFGFIWDDAQWFGRVVDRPWLGLLRPMTDFQFYRPGTMVYNRLFLRPGGTFDAPLLHWMQLCWHLLNVSLIYAIGRRLKLAHGAALAVAVLAALYPFSYQAVAWAAPQQPLAAALQHGAWLAYLIHSGRRSRPAEQRRGAGFRWLPLGLSLVLFILALSVQESTVALAFLPLLFELLGERAGRRRPILTSRFYPLPQGVAAPEREWMPALIYPGVAVVFGLLWLQVPRQAAITGLLLDEKVALYLFQGLIYPILGRPQGYPPDYTMPSGLLAGLVLLVPALLLGTAARLGRGRLATMGLIWALLSLAPALVGLSYSYVSFSPRLLYYAAPGVALLWVCALWPAGGRPRLWRAAGVVALALIVVQSSFLLAGFQQLYRTGTNHLAELLDAVGHDSGRYLFANFPDRYRPKRSPYPLGYWGLTLAPVVVDLGDFATRLTGSTPQTTSVSLPWVDAENRERSPLEVDSRGVITSPQELYRLAAGQDGVYLSRYLAEGGFALQLAGSLQPRPDRSCGLAWFDATICLQQVEVTTKGVRPHEMVRLQLAWSTETPLPPHLAISAQLVQPGSPPLAQSDGDSWGGLLPLADWQPGDLIVEQRILELPPVVGELFLLVTVYDRTTGERLPVTAPDGRPLADNAYRQTLEP